MKSSIFLSLALASVASAHGPHFSYGVHSVHPVGVYAHHGYAHHGLGHLGYGHGLGHLGYAHHGLGYGYGLGHHGLLGHHVEAAPAEAAEERKKRDIHGLYHHEAAVPVAVGGYVASAGCNGDLCGPTHEVAGLVPALATVTHKSEGEVSLTTGSAVHHVGYAHHGLGHLGYAHHGLGHLGYAGHGLGHLGYAGHGLGHLGYAGHGLGHLGYAGHGLGHLGYGYAGLGHLGYGHHGLLGHHGLVVAAPAEAAAEE